MKTFQQLRFEVNSDRAIDLVTAIQSKLSDGWTRKPDKDLTPSQRILSMHVFTCDEREGRLAASVFLIAEETELRVANIIPENQNRLDYDQYNKVLNSFLDSGARHAANELSIKLEVTSPEIDLTRYISGDDLRKLRHVVAVRMASGWHELDEEDWVEFLFSMHAQGWKLSLDYFHRLLTEELGASPELVEDLVLKYEFARELLTHKDKLNPQAA